jgi:hypothetical protein
MIHQVDFEGVFANTDGMGIKLSWVASDGYGELQIKRADDGNCYIDSEHMSKEFVMEVLKKLVDDSKLID